MRDGKCTKCGNEAVHARPKSCNEGHPLLQIAFLNMASLTPHVCITCGYTEFYVTSKTKRATIAEKWPQVEPNHSSSESR